MLLSSNGKRHAGQGLRAALRDAHETYRRYSEAEPGDREPPETEPPPELPARRSLPLADRRRGAGRWLRDHRARRDDPDVFLDVPRLHVDEIDLKLDELDARVALEAHVLDLLRLDVGVNAKLRGVDLAIKGVDAQALLEVRLENLAVIVDRVMSTIDRNPQILERLTDHLGATLGQVGAGAAEAVRDLGNGAGAAIDDVGSVARTLAPDSGPPSSRPAH